MCQSKIGFQQRALICKTSELILMSQLALRGASYQKVVKCKKLVEFGFGRVPFIKVAQTLTFHFHPNGPRG